MTTRVRLVTDEAAEFTTRTSRTARTVPAFAPGTPVVRPVVVPPGRAPRAGSPGLPGTGQGTRRGHPRNPGGSGQATGRAGETP